MTILKFSRGTYSPLLHPRKEGCTMKLFISIRQCTYNSYHLHFCCSFKGLVLPVFTCSCQLTTFTTYQTSLAVRCSNRQELQDVFRHRFMRHNMNGKRNTFHGCELYTRFHLKGKASFEHRSYAA